MGDDFTGRKIWLTTELVAAGFTEGKIRAAVRRADLHKVSRGVYTSEPPDDVLALRALSRLVPEVVYTGRRAGRRDRLLLRARTVTGSRRRHGVAVVSPLQAAIDVRGSTAPTSSDAELRRFLTRMYDGTKGNDRLTADHTALTTGSAHAESLLEGLTTGTASALERRALLLVRRAVEGLPVTVLTNTLVGPYRFDIVIPEARVVIEIDSFRYHAVTDMADTRGFVRDRWKGNAAAEWGWALFRYTDFCVGPGGVDDRIAAQLRDVVCRRINRRWATVPGYPDPAVWTFHPQLR